MSSGLEALKLLAPYRVNTLRLARPMTGPIFRKDRRTAISCQVCSLSAALSGIVHYGDRAAEDGEGHEGCADC